MSISKSQERLLPYIRAEVDTWSKEKRIAMAVILRHGGDGTKGAAQIIIGEEIESLGNGPLVNMRRTATALGTLSAVLDGVGGVAFKEAVIRILEE